MTCTDKLIWKTELSLSGWFLPTIIPTFSTKIHSCKNSKTRMFVGMKSGISVVEGNNWRHFSKKCTVKCRTAGHGHVEILFPGDSFLALLVFVCAVCRCVQLFCNFVYIFGNFLAVHKTQLVTKDFGTDGIDCAFLRLRSFRRWTGLAAARMPMRTLNWPQAIKVKFEKVRSPNMFETLSETDFMAAKRS